MATWIQGAVGSGWLFLCLRRAGPTVDGRNPAPPKKPWNGEQWIPMASKWCRILSTYSIFGLGVLAILGVGKEGQAGLNKGVVGFLGGLGVEGFQGV